MYCGSKAIIAVLLILRVALIKSDHIEDDCRDIQCPKTSLGCPSDSELKTDDEDNVFDNIPSELIHLDQLSDSALETSTQSTHEVKKRSSDLFKLKNHLVHVISKRESGNIHLEAEIKKCCPEFQCACKECSGIPKCKNDEMMVLKHPGNGLPGICCSIYECVPAVECTATSQPNVSYYKDECTKCDCYGGQELCQKLCEIRKDESANNCYSEYLNRPMLNGDSWLEDQDCTECKCIDGESHCQESVCDAVDCPNPVKKEGRCCKVCPPTTPITTSVPPSTEVPRKTFSPSSVPPTETTSVKSHITDLPTLKTTAGDKKVDSDILPEKIEFDIESTLSTPEVRSSLGLFEKYGYIIVASVLAVSIVALIGCITFMLLKKQKKKKSMYSTIPCFESNQSSSVALA